MNNANFISRGPDVAAQPAILRLKDLTVYLSLSPSSIYDAVASGHLPQPIRLGKRTSGWLREEIDQVLAQRAAARDPNRPFAGM
jgi:predicted DNA-binding transcriptional regulator AlpA